MAAMSRARKRAESGKASATSAGKYATSGCAEPAV